MKQEFRAPDIEHATYIDVSPDRVYETLTTAEGWDAWFTQGTTVDPKPGGKIQLRWKNFGAGRWTTEDGGRVVAADRGTQFAFEWAPAGHPTTVSITLRALGSGTLVKLVETGYLMTEDDIAVFPGSAVGWGEALTLLKFYLEHGLTYGEVPEDAPTHITGDDGEEA